MSEHSTKSLLEEGRKLSSNGRFVALGGFGKHPGWDDHIIGLGLETPSLNFAETVLYKEGIGGQIDSGAWEKLEPSQQLPGFNHVFLWQRDGQFLVGRMWSSSDGKGRKRYPMAVCLHFVGVSLAWALKQAVPVLAELAQGCAAAHTAEEVKSLLDSRRAVLRHSIESTDGRGEFAPVTPDTLNRILGGNGELGAEGMLRVLYQTQSQMSSFTPRAFNDRSKAKSRLAQQVRVPALGKDVELTFLFWTRFFLTQVDAAAPLFMALPLGEGWVDVTVGEPASHEFFCLRASPKAMPLASEVPYNLDDGFRGKATAFIEGFRRGETTTAADLITSPAAARRGWFKWLGGSGIFIL